MHGNPVQPLGRAGAGAGSARRGLRLAPIALGAIASLALVLHATPAGAEGRLQKIRGNLGVGYARLVGDPSPGGSFSLGVGMNYPLGDRWRAGVALGSELLGARVVERGSLAAQIEYSMIEMLALAHFQPARLSPLGRISFGPGLFSARAELQVSAGGAGFSDLAVEEVAPGFALDGTLIQRRDSPVKIGFETGLRLVFLENDTWTMALVRVAFHY